MTETLTESQILRQIQTSPSYVQDGVKYWVGSRGDKYYFDEEEADRWVNLLERFCCLVDDDIYKPLILMDWHREFIRELFGWKRCDNHLRRYRRVFLMVPRKNAKSLLIACILLGMICWDGENRAQAYIQAADEKQAKVMFTMAVEQVEYFKQKKPLFGNDFSVKAPEKDQIGGSIMYEPTRSVLRPLTKSKRGKHGLNVSAYGIDEWHEIMDSESEAALRTGTINRKQPIGFYTTTAGNRIDTPAHRGYLRYRKVKLGQIKQDNALVVIYEPEHGAEISLDLSKPGVIETLKSVNPGWGVTVNEQSIQDVIDESLGDPVKEAEVIQYHFNRWTAGGDRWIPLHKWSACAEDFTAEDLRGRKCIGGLDCANIFDTNAFVLLFPEFFEIQEHEVKQEDGSIIIEHEVNANVRVLSWFWVPDKTARNMAHQGEAYEDWIKMGHLFRTDGEVADQDKIGDDILRIRDQYDFKILEVGYDPAEAFSLTKFLKSKGFNMTEVVQSRKNLSAPTKVVNTMVRQQLLRHNKNDVLTNHVTNAVLSVKERLHIIQKPSEIQKIDGAAALIDATHRLITRPIPRKLPNPKIWG